MVADDALGADPQISKAHSWFRFTLVSQVHEPPLALRLIRDEHTGAVTRGGEQGAAAVQHRLLGGGDGFAACGSGSTESRRWAGSTQQPIEAEVARSAHPKRSVWREREDMATSF